MSITPAELRHVRFAQVRRGYDTEAVDRALESVADSIEDLLHERDALAERVRQLEAELQRHRDNEAMLTQTLQLAERAAEELKVEARAEADRIVADAHRAAAAVAPMTPLAAAPRSALPDPAFVELLGETRAIRSLLQTLLTDGGGAPPFAPRS